MCCANCCRWKGSKLKSPTDVVETTFHVRYAETDQMGIVHHAAYLVWMEEGRSQWLRAHGNSYAQFEKEGLMLAVSEVNARYLQPARYDQLVTIRCWVESVQSRLVQFNYEIVEPESQAILVKGYSKHICLNRARQVALIPDKWRRILEGTAS